jgi:serine/threonine-protein kinase
MGTVYRARDPLIERTVAIKTVSIAQLQQEGTDAELRFLHEAQSAGRLSHPHIVTIYDVGEADDLAYIAMEYLSGATLRDLMNKGPMPLDLAIETATQMAEALAFAHEHGVIHRDIKPANVVVTGQRGHIKLTDFGIAHLINSDHTRAGQMLGSPRYMSPEQAMGREIDGRSDIFSLGAVLYEMLTGQYAFDGDSLPTIVYRVINEAPVDAASLRSKLPAELSSLLARMLDKNPEVRPDANALVNALRGVAPLPASQTPLPQPAHRTSRRLPKLTLETLLVVLLLIGVGVLISKNTDEPAAPPPMPSALPRTDTPKPLQPQEDADTAAGGNEANSAVIEPTEANQAVRKPAIPKDPYLVGLDKKQVELRIQRTELLLEYTEQHPDVVQVDRQLEQLQIERRAYLRQLQRKPKS